SCVANSGWMMLFESSGRGPLAASPRGPLTDVVQAHVRRSLVAHDQLRLAAQPYSIVPYQSLSSPSTFLHAVHCALNFLNRSWHSAKDLGRPIKGPPAVDSPDGAIAGGNFSSEVRRNPNRVRKIEQSRRSA